MSLFIFLVNRMNTSWILNNRFKLLTIDGPNNFWININELKILKTIYLEWCKKAVLETKVLSETLLI